MKTLLHGAGVSQTASVGLGVLAALLPKCQLGCAAYGTMACLFGLSGLLRWERLWPAVLGLLALNRLILGRAARASKHYGPFLLSGARSRAVTIGRWRSPLPPLADGGAALILAASLWDWAHRRRPWPAGLNREGAAGLSA